MTDTIVPASGDSLNLPATENDSNPERWNDLLQFLEPKKPLYCPETPSLKQKIFLRYNGREALFGGAGGGGKSSALLMAALQMVDIPDYSAILFRRTFADLNLPGALMDRFRLWMAEYDDVRWNSQSNTATFPSGARITFGYLNNSKDFLRYQGCCTSDHDVLTSTGWKPINEVQTGEEVASLDTMTREVVYLPVSKTHEYDFDGELVSSHPGTDVSFRLTPNHRVLHSMQKDSRLQFTYAENLPATARFPQAGEYLSGQTPEVFEFKAHWSGKSQNLSFTSEDFAEFLGWFIAEGNLSVGDGSTIRISQHNKVNGDRIENLLKRSGAHVNRTERGMTFCNSALYAYLETTGHLTPNKMVPREVLEVYDTHFLKRLLWALIEGDGTWRNSDSGHFVTTSRQLADDVMELSAKTGFRATLNIRKHSSEHQFPTRRENSDFYHVFVLKPKRDTSFGAYNQPIREPYIGKVYCLTVPYTHNFLVRHNGRMHYTGNSEYQFIGFDEVTHIRQADYRYLASRLRKPAHGPLSQVPLRMRAASNPAPNWVRQYFIVEGQANGRIFIPSFIDDNPGIDVAAYRKSLSILDPLTRRQLEFGDWWASAEGSLFKREDFPIVGPDDLPEIDSSAKVVRFWDLAATEESEANQDPDWTVGTLVMFFKGIAYVLDVKRARLRPDKVEELVKETAWHDGKNVPVRMEMEGGSAGKTVVDSYARYVLPGFDFDGIRASGDKETRARPMASAASKGNVILLRGAWNTTWLDELSSFPEACDHDDQVDSASGAFNFTAGLGGGRRSKLQIIL